MPSTEYLSGFWKDTFTIVGAAGFLLTAIGIWLAVLQMRRTASATIAASRAAVDALNESRSQYNKYVIAQCSRLLSEIRFFVKLPNWEVAAIRLNDIADLLLQVVGNDTDWARFAERLHSMEKTFERIHKGEISFNDSLKGKWNKLDRELRTKISLNFGPFPKN